MYKAYSISLFRFTFLEISIVLDLQKTLSVSNYTSLWNKS